jgi:CheY-like chemotaxis protein
MDSHPDIEATTLVSRFEVADTGIGMSEEFKDHIFEAFVQADDFNNRVLYKGSGLGMAIVKQYVDMLNGTIEIDSKLDKGTRITVTLPFEIDGSAPLTNADAAAKEFVKKDFTGTRILLAEDNDINVEIAKAIIEGIGIEVEVAEDGQVALDKFKNSAPGEYQCILMDIMMPNMNGYEATKAIRKLDRPDAQKVPVIAMTANAFADDIKNAMNAGMNAHIAKPIDADLLLETITKFIKKQ